jgi:hypothetical protein
MGNIISPPEETIVLVPPRFSTRGLTCSIEMESPMSVYFGKLFRKEVLYDLHSFKGQSFVDVLVAPEFPPSAAAHVSLSGSVKEKTVHGGSFNLHFNKYVTKDIHALGRVALATGSNISGHSLFSYNFDRGRVSATYSKDDNNTIVGLRVSSSQVMLGVEFPFPDPEKVSAWMISRPTTDITVGIRGSILKPNEPVEICASLDRKIPNTDSTYCVSSSLTTPSNEITVGFSQHLVTHRKVYNLFEDKRVKFIANYIDIAIEATSAGSKTNVLAGVSWQPNKNILSKVHVSTSEGVVGTIAARNWWLPSVLASASVGVDVEGNPFVGGRLQVSNWLTAVEYEKGRRVSELPTTKWLSVVDNPRFDTSNQI